MNPLFTANYYFDSLELLAMINTIPNVDKVLFKAY